MKRDESNRNESEEQFQYWLAHMDDALDDFLAMTPAETKRKLDYSPTSLDALESWILSRYSSFGEINEEANAEVFDALSRYIGEVFRKNIGGRWMLMLEDPKNVFFGLPVIGHFPGVAAEVCPLTLATATTDRRTGQFLLSVFENVKQLSMQKESTLLEMKKKLGVR